MNTRFLYAILLFFCLLPLHAGGEEHLPDSLLTDDGVYAYTFSDFAKAQRIMKELRRRELLPEFRLDMVEGDLYFNTGKYYRALAFYKHALASDSVKQDDERHMAQLHRMITCYDCLHDEANKAHYVKLLLRKAEACGSSAMKSVALFNMGQMAYYQEDKARGYDLMLQAVRLMEASDYKYKYDNLRYDYNTLLIMQQRDGQYEAALQTLGRLEEVVTQEMKGTTAMEGLPEKEKKTMYAQRTLILSRLGRHREAAEAYRRWQEIGDAYSKDDYLIIPYLMDRGMYDKVIEMNTSRERFLKEQNDTINYHMLTLKRTLGNAYASKRDYRTAARYYKELAVLTDSLKEREQRSSAQELVTVYATHEKDLQIKEQERQLDRQRIALAIGVCVVAFALLVISLIIRYLRSIKRKNRALAQQIDSQLACREELLKAREEIERLRNPDPGKKAPVKEEKEAHAGRAALFNRLDRLVEEEKLFLDANFSREHLLNQLHISKNTFAQLIQAYAGTNFNGYINNKRLEHALRLLKDNPGFTIEAVATDSGFSSARNFYRTFRDKYGMTPAEYRHSLARE